MKSMNKKRTVLIIAVVITLLVGTPLATRAVLQEKRLGHEEAGAQVTPEQKAGTPAVSSTPVTIKNAAHYDELYQDILKCYGYSEEDKERRGTPPAENFGSDAAAGERKALEETAQSDTQQRSTGADTGSQDSADSDIMTSGADGKAAPEFSGTNNQVDGVQEADIIKTDGVYIYAINSEKLNIIEANGANLQLVASIPQTGLRVDKYFDLLLTKTRLIALRQKTGSGGSPATGIDIFDITNPASPKKLNSLTQSGVYNESRVIENSLYLISDYSHSYNKVMSMQHDKPATFVPVYDEAGTTSLAAPADIFMPPNRETAQYTLISGIDISGSGTFVSKKSFYGIRPTIYASEKNIYLAVESYNENTREESAEGGYYRDVIMTAFMRVSLNDGVVQLGASCSVPGSVLNQFSMDEYKDIFRVVVTNDRAVYGKKGAVVSSMKWLASKIFAGYHDDYAGDYYETIQTNAVYAMDQALNITGSITGLAEDERVYSARFMGDMAYFVTFRETDPLFSVDLRDPKNPRIVGALKIPGFSEYLHPYNSGLLFGLGQERSADGAEFKGVKLSMFDNSNPRKVTEASKLVLSEYSGTPASSDHKAILVNGAHALVAFPADSDYVICSYGIDGFKVEKKIRLESSPLSGYYNDRSSMGDKLRGLFIGEYFYIISARSITAFAMDQNYAKRGDLRIGTDDALPISRENEWLYGEAYSYNPGDDEVIY